MNPVELAHLPEYLKSRRWFGGKAWPIKQVSLVDNVHFDPTEGASDQNLALAVAEVQYDLGSAERYLLCVCPHQDGMLTDATESDAFVRILFNLIRHSQQLPSGSGTLRGEAVPQAQAVFEKMAVIPIIRRLNVEQSNTSVVIGEQMILKVIRKLESGVSPELEIGQFLARVGFKGAPMLLGALKIDGLANATLAVIHEFIKTEMDGWAYTLDAFQKSEVPPAQFLSEAKALGSVLGELHAAFASDKGDTLFAPEPILREDLQRWSASLIGELGVTFAMAAHISEALAGKRALLLDHAKKLAQLEPSGMKTRIHGDLHLGQTLRSNNRWLIFDFEGEPSRSFSQRREKYSPLKDVAGMLRSFRYAEETVVAQGKPSGKRADLTRSAFLDGYRASVARSELHPTDQRVFDTLLMTLELEKLLYELRYEIQHRPDWVHVPLRGLLSWESP